MPQVDSEMRPRLGVVFRKWATGGSEIQTIEARRFPSTRSPRFSLCRCQHPATDRGGWWKCNVKYKFTSSSFLEYFRIPLLPLLSLLSSAMLTPARLCLILAAFTPLVSAHPNVYNNYSGSDSISLLHKFHLLLQAPGSH